MRRSLVCLGALVAAVGCNKTTAPNTISAPMNLQYELRPSGDPATPAGLRLEWDAVSDPHLGVYNVYSRASSSAQFDLRGSTTSTTFDDAGVPDLDYYVTAVTTNGDESQPSASVRIDERLALEAPTALTSTSLDEAVQLNWADNPFLDAPSAFKQYRVYSTSYSGANNTCGAAWSLEGTTVSPTFLVAALTNGVSRCYGVSAESQQGYESLWSPLREDTPRPDARNVLLWDFDTDAAHSGFRFYHDANGNGQVDPLELGIIEAGDATDADFWVYRDPGTGDLYLVPQRAGTQVALYGTSPVTDLTSIDLAPDSGYDRTAIQAVTGYGYVFSMLGGDNLPRYGAVRVTDVAADHLIFDWSYQTAAGNPELQIHGGLPTATQTGIVVVRGR